MRNMVFDIKHEVNMTVRLFVYVFLLKIMDGKKNTMNLLLAEKQFGARILFYHFIISLEMTFMHLKVILQI